MMAEDFEVHEYFVGMYKVESIVMQQLFLQLLMMF